MIEVMIDDKVVEVVEAPETYACRGCIGEFDSTGICYQLPVGCSTENIIWVRKENELH